MASWIEEIVARYYQKKGYLVTMNYKFFIPRETLGKRAGGWTDIDVLAYNGEEIHIVQCKAFTGTAKAEKVGNQIKKWFDLAEQKIRGDEHLSFMSNARIVKVLVVEEPPTKKLKNILEESNIRVVLLRNVIKELIEIIRSEVNKFQEKGRRKGKEDDILLAFIRELILQGLI